MKSFRQGSGIVEEMPERRNFAHAGCLFGAVLGLSLGVVAAWMLTLRTGSLALAMVGWLVLTIGLAAIGYVLGERRSRPARQ
jgi:hypothetical protein